MSHGPPAERLDFLGRLRSRLAVDLSDDDVGPLLRQAQRNRLADPLAGARDNRHFAFESLFHASSLPAAKHILRHLAEESLDFVAILKIEICRQIVESFPIDKLPVPIPSANGCEAVMVKYGIMW